MPIRNSMMIRGSGDLAVRLLWLAMVAIHVSPVVRLSSAAFAGELHGVRWISLAALVLSLGFFALKAAGIPFLRVRCRWTAVVLFLVACGLLHGNATPHQWLEKTGYTVLAAGSVVGVTGVQDRRLRRRFAMLAGLLRSALSTRIDVLQRTLEQASITGSALYWQILEWRHGPPRAPPERLVLLSC